jgi:transcriptional regulator with XRE-family HTH domain
MHVVLKADQLRRLLAERSLRQADLAHLLRVSEAHVSRLLAHERQAGPRLRAAMLAALGMRFSDLFSITRHDKHLCRKRPLRRDQPDSADEAARPGLTPNRR